MLETHGLVADQRDFLALDNLGKQLAVWATLIGEGPVPAQEKATMSLCANRLRSQGWVDFERLRADGDLYRAISTQLGSATRTGSNGRFHIPRNTYVRAFNRTSDMNANDWADCTVRARRVRANNRSPGRRHSPSFPNRPVPVWDRGRETPETNPQQHRESHRKLRSTGIVDTTPEHSEPECHPNRPSSRHPASPPRHVRSKSVPFHSVPTTPSRPWGPSTNGRHME